jgi:hypothetical protein
MPVEFDHLFIFTDVGAPVADQLVALGVLEGSSNIHPGQGTTNRRFFFHNAMLEFLWVHNPIEVQSADIQSTRLGERWANRDRVCPIGICFRPAADFSNIPLFPSWDYQPPYLPKNWSIVVANNSDILTEPMLFQISFGKRPDTLSLEKAQPLDHPVGWQEITRVEIISPVTTSPSPELQAALDSKQVKIRLGNEYYVELGFDGETQGQQLDLRSSLSLMMYW